MDIEKIMAIGKDNIQRAMMIYDHRTGWYDNMSIPKQKGLYKLVITKIWFHPIPSFDFYYKKDKCPTCGRY